MPCPDRSNKQLSTDAARLTRVPNPVLESHGRQVAGMANHVVVERVWRGWGDPEPAKHGVRSATTNKEGLRPAITK